MKRKRKSSGNRHETLTYKLNDVQADPGASYQSHSLFTLPMRKPGWFPDGIEVPWQKIQRLFPEEVVGRNKTGCVPFGVQFCDVSLNSNAKRKGAAGKTTSNNYQWILGHSFQEPLPGATTAKWSPLRCLVWDLMKKIRKYNASLYRLRRLHYWFMYSGQNCQFPPRNPHGDVKDPLPDVHSENFRNLVRDAEDDWVKVTDDLSAFIDAAISGYPNIKPKIQLLATDMVEVNGYVVSMRVVVKPYGTHPLEPGGSSSHVSISSAFSSF